MSRIKVGDRVCPILAMNMKGTVVEIYERHHKTMMIGGTLSGATYAKVQYDKTSSLDNNPMIGEYRLNDLMKDE